MNIAVVSADYAEALGSPQCASCQYCADPQAASEGDNPVCLHSSAVMPSGSGRYSCATQRHKEFDNFPRTKHCGLEGTHYKRRAK